MIRHSNRRHLLTAALAVLSMIVTNLVRAEALPELPGAHPEPTSPSNNPKLLGPEDPGDAVAIAPQWAEEDDDHGPSELLPLVYNVRTREARVFRGTYGDGRLVSPRTAEGGQGDCGPRDDGAQQGGGAIVFGSDGRDEVSNTLVTPWNRIGKIYAWFHDPDDDPDSTTMQQEVAWADCVGTGALIGACHVLTAGHVIYNQDPRCGNLGWAEKVIFVPGLYTDDSGITRWPYGGQYATRIMSFEGWTQRADEDHDMGFFVLNESIGNTTGWFGYSTRDSDGATRNISGYPGDLAFGLEQFHMAGEINCENTYNLKYKIDTAGGQSGAPIWQYDGENRYVVGVHAHGGVPFGCGFETQNRGVRITSGKFDVIQDWKADNDCPIDEPDLGDDEDEDDDDLVITRKLIPLDILIRNFGPRRASRFRVAAFLSIDDKITRDDVFLGFGAAPEGLGCFEATSVHIDGVIPDDIEPGSYYVGWFIDPDQRVNESDEENNRRVLTSKEVRVIDPDNISVEDRESLRRFLRGDANDDSRFDISDPMQIVGHLFLGNEPPRCLRAADNNEDGKLDLSDAIDGLNDLFLRASPPRTCTEGRAPRTLGCVSYSHCP